MKLAIFSALLLFVGLASSGPVAYEDVERVVVNEDFYMKDFLIYTSQNDIVKIVVPIHSVIMIEDINSEDTGSDDVLLFFVEKDLASGQDRGLFVRKNGEITKILDNGRDIATVYSNGEQKIYFAASDGIYIYNAQENKAEKYGSVTDDLLNIAGDNSGDVIYVLTKNKKILKVTNNGEKKVAISDVQNAEQIIMDYNDNLYFYTTEKEVFVINEGGVRKIEGLPKHSSELTLIRPPFVMEDGVPLVVDHNAYIVYSNGTAEKTVFEIRAKPSAYSMEGTLVHYYAYKKKLYELNLLAIMFSDDFGEVKSYLQGKQDEIQTIASRPSGTKKIRNRSRH